MELIPNQANLSADMEKWVTDDPEEFAKFQRDMQTNDGDTMAYDVAKAVREGHLSLQGGADIASGLQQVAYGNGGQKISDAATASLAAALGGKNYLNDDPPDTEEDDAGIDLFGGVFRSLFSNIMGSFGF